MEISFTDKFSKYNFNGNFGAVGLNFDRNIWVKKNKNYV